MFKRTFHSRCVREILHAGMINTIGVWKMSDREAPRNRRECIKGLRPCPYVGCRYHLAIDVIPETGRIVFNVPEEACDAGVVDLGETCALDVAARGPWTLDYIRQFLGVTRERVRQIEAAALRKIKKEVRKLRD